MSRFRLSTPPALANTAQRLAVLLAQPGRRVTVTGHQHLTIVCVDADAVHEFLEQLPHGLAIRKITYYTLTQDGQFTFALELGS